ncbi:hypothetical protein BT96DRAFT_923208 [Gymnopus androsaceus JB14]|uniref:Uncharacterized protein n=1 Tax=Gymnopus androsaceus JB14 TaxID=1447944 RepID=A0A6A4HA90_9AGAR|nr:hypothetical protein BT96DRAFT_923208 [Gymnopus androsaceus JB14]
MSESNLLFRATARVSQMLFRSASFPHCSFTTNKTRSEASHRQGAMVTNSAEESINDDSESIEIDDTVNNEAGSQMDENSKQNEQSSLPWSISEYINPGAPVPPPALLIDTSTLMPVGQIPQLAVPDGNVIPTATIPTFHSSLAKNKHHQNQTATPPFSISLTRNTQSPPPTSTTRSGPIIIRFTPTPDDNDSESDSESMSVRLNVDGTVDYLCTGGAAGASAGPCRLRMATGKQPDLDSEEESVPPVVISSGLGRYSSASKTVTPDDTFEATTLTSDAPNAISVPPSLVVLPGFNSAGPAVAHSGSSSSGHGGDVSVSSTLESQPESTLTRPADSLPTNVKAASSSPSVSAPTVEEPPSPALNVSAAALVPPVTLLVASVGPVNPPVFSESCTANTSSSSIFSPSSESSERKRKRSRGEADDDDDDDDEEGRARSKLKSEKWAGRGKSGSNSNSASTKNTNCTIQPSHTQLSPSSAAPASTIPASSPSSNSNSSRKRAREPEDEDADAETTVVGVDVPSEGARGEEQQQQEQQQDGSDSFRRRSPRKRICK